MEGTGIEAPRKFVLWGRDAGWEGPGRGGPGPGRNLLGKSHSDTFRNKVTTKFMYHFGELKTSAF